MPYSDNDSPPNFLVPLGLGAILLIASGVFGLQAIRFAVNGRQTLGQVTDCYLYGVKHPSQTCQYDFLVAGQRYSGSVDGSAYAKGQTVSVNYLEGNPDNNSLNHASWFPVGVILFIVGVGLLGLSVKLFMSNDDLITD
jgi:hypothetical protein